MNNPDNPIAEEIADAVARRLSPTIATELRRHQERVSRIWLTPPQAARLANCNDRTVYHALHDGSLAGAFNQHANGGRGAWHIRRADLDAWAATLHSTHHHPETTP